MISSSLKIDIPMPDDQQPAEKEKRLYVRLHIDHNGNRKAIVLTLCRVETAGGFEQIPLSTMRFFNVAPAPRRNARQLADVAARLRPFAATIAACYREGTNHDEQIRAMIARALAS